MTMSYCKKGVGGANYYIECSTPAADDYYTRGFEPPGVWYVSPGVGGLADRKAGFGFADGESFHDVEDSTELFAQLAKGSDIDGNPLVKNFGDPRRVALHDFTFSAPKSISVIWSQADAGLKADIERAQADASRKAIDHLSKFAYDRREPEEKCGLIGASFGHGSSRELDPQLHTHFVILNLVERADWTTGALQERDMMNHQGSAASLYHLELAWEMKKLGFSVTRSESLFEIDGVPEQAIDGFSTRRKQIMQAVEAELVARGISPELANDFKGLLAVAALKTRANKVEMSREELDILWAEKGKEFGFTQNEVEEIRSLGEVDTLTDSELLHEARIAVRDLCNQRAYFTEADLTTAVAVRLIGHASAEDALHAIELVKTNELIENAKIVSGRVVNVYSTLEVYATERAMLELSMRKSGHAIAQEKLNLPEGLSGEQRQAAIRTLTDTAGVSVIEGTAGAGKTRVAASIAQEYERAGYKVVGLATGWKQALNLKADADLADGKALTGWINEQARLSSAEGGDAAQKQVLFLDEAGMTGVDQMHAVLEIAAKTNAKVILIGDSLQHKAIGIGDPLRTIVGKIQSSRLSEIRRQADEGDRSAVHLMFSGKAEDTRKALDHYHEKGQVNIVDGGDIAVNSEIVGAWLKNREQFPEQTQMVLASDGKSVLALNQMVHEKLKQAGHIGDGVLVETMSSKRFGTSGVEFSAGDRIRFRVNGRGDDSHVKNQTEGTIQEIDSRSMKILVEDGTIVTVKHDDERWHHKEHKALGIELAYASTAYSSQGPKWDRVIHKDAAWIRNETAGVAISRHVNDYQLFIDREARHAQASKQLADFDRVTLDAYDDNMLFEDVAEHYARRTAAVSTTDLAGWTKNGVSIDDETALAEARLDRQIRLQKESKRFVMGSTDPSEGSLSLVDRDDFKLKITASREADIKMGRDALMRSGIPASAILSAETSGSLRYRDDGKPEFIGLRPRDNQAVYSTALAERAHADPQEAKFHGVRERFPILLQPVDPNGRRELTIVASGIEGLRAQGARPGSAVLVVPSAQSLKSGHVKDLIASAEVVHVDFKNESQQELKSTIQEIRTAARETATNERLRSIQSAQGVTPGLSCLTPEQIQSAERNVARQEAAAAEAAAREQAAEQARQRAEEAKKARTL